jgi:tRNA A-37 threonylcarbamoyl transferase component Bud32
MRRRTHGHRLGELLGGKYRIQRFIADGGMGAVFEAHHTLIKRRFAVKFLHSDLADDPEILARFRREAEATGALQSEHIAAIVDFGAGNDGTPYIVMEYLVGESLAALLERAGPLPVARAADICAQACNGVEAAHAAGIIHRDLKPHNLFICRRTDGTDLVKVLDFGVAKLLAPTSGSVSVTSTGTVLGTPLYMSPEQARGDKQIDRRTDIYGLGAILYEMVSGRPPHPGDSPHAVLFHVFTQAAVPLDSAQPGVTAALRDLVDSALSFDPDARPASAQTLGRALAPFASRQAWPESTSAEEPARASRDAATLVAVDEGREAAPAPSPVTATTRSRLPARVLGGALAITSILALALALVLTGWRSPPSAVSGAPVTLAPAIARERTAVTDTTTPESNLLADAPLLSAIEVAPRGGSATPASDAVVPHGSTPRRRRDRSPNAIGPTAADAVTTPVGASTPAGLAAPPVDGAIRRVRSEPRAFDDTIPDAGGAVQ